MVKMASSSTKKMMRRVSIDNVVGEDLKFADDSLENRIAFALQMGVYKSSGTGTQCSITHLSASEPLDCTVNDMRCKFEEWEPERFAAIRTSFGVDPIEYRCKRCLPPWIAGWLNRI